MFRPNFTAAEIDGGHVRVRGVSRADDPDELADILDIQVVLAQGERVGHARVRALTDDWVADVPVKHSGHDGPDFKAGEAMVTGIELHRENARTTTWSQPIAITKA